MTTEPTCPRTAAPAPMPGRARDDGTGGFVAIAAMGAVFAGFVSHGQSRDHLVTGLAMVCTFVGAYVGLHLLQVVVHVLAKALRIALPLGLVLAVGCALDWRWAERTTRSLLELGGRGAAAASHAVGDWLAR